MPLPISVNIISCSTCCEVTELTDIICNTAEKTPSSSLLIVVTVWDVLYLLRLNEHDKLGGYLKLLRGYSYQRLLVLP